MDVKQAVGMAKDYFGQLFDEEKLKNIGLEEVRFDPDGGGTWMVTLGFSRPWDEAAPFAQLSGQAPHRSYKVVHIRDGNGEVRQVVNRETA